jgi:hypothetical protein
VLLSGRKNVKYEGGSNLYSTELSVMFEGSLSILCICD